MTPKQTTTTETDIHSRALLVWLTITTWTARKYDKKISQKVNSEYHASSDAGRYNKFLLPGDCAAYKTLVNLAGQIRAEHYSTTLAWSDEGWRLLPVDNFMKYTERYREQQSELRRALDAFIANYPTMQANARSLLNGMYRDEDYPTVQDLRTRFTLDVQYSPVPASGDIRVDLAHDQLQAIEASIANRVESAVKIAVQDSWKRLYEVVARVSETLNVKDKIFRDTLISNAVDICESLKALNVTNDPDLEAMRVRVQSELTRTEPDILRDKPRQRAMVAAKADDILKAMSSFYTVQS